MGADSAGPLYARVFGRAPVYDPIFSRLSPRPLVRLALTCRAACLAIAEFKKRAFSINRHLSRYFTDPISFRSLQARTNTLISGSNALQFLDRSFYPEADLDLYTHPGHSAEVAQFLVETEGYHYVPRVDQQNDWKVATITDRELTARRIMAPSDSNPEYPTTDIRAVWTFEKANSDKEPLKVQIIEARSSPLESILGFHSTCVMNFISSDAAYSLYPVATFESRGALAMISSRSSPRAIRKYISRGWRIYYAPTPNDRVFFVERARWVTDRHTWRLPLDQTGVQERPPLSRASAPLPCDPVLFNGWKFMLYIREPDDIVEEEIRCYTCRYYPLKTTLFRYNYAIPDEKLQLEIRDWAAHQGRQAHVQFDKVDWIWFDSDMQNFLQKKKRKGFVVHAN